MLWDCLLGLRCLMPTEDGLTYLGGRWYRLGKRYGGASVYGEHVAKLCAAADATPAELTRRAGVKRGLDS